MSPHKLINGVRVELTQSEIDVYNAEQKAWADGAFDRVTVRLREQRNALLAETDWMANKDVTLTTAWKTYRQALRDLPSGLDTVEKVNAVTWPTKPE